MASNARTAVSIVESPGRAVGRSTYATARDLEIELTRQSRVGGQATSPQQRGTRQRARSRRRWQSRPGRRSQGLGARTSCAAGSGSGGCLVHVVWVALEGSSTRWTRRSRSAISTGRCTFGGARTTVSWWRLRLASRCRSMRSRSPVESMNVVPRRSRMRRVGSRSRAIVPTRAYVDLTEMAARVVLSSV